ncbi:hypothetical protein ACFLUK_03075, partial [Chloroflexota bacterium]
AREEAKKKAEEAQKAKEFKKQTEEEAREVKRLEKSLEEVEKTCEQLKAGKIGTKEAIQKLSDISERITY